MLSYHVALICGISSQYESVQAYLPGKRQNQLVSCRRIAHGSWMIIDIMNSLAFASWLIRLYEYVQLIGYTGAMRAHPHACTHSHTNIPMHARPPTHHTHTLMDTHNQLATCTHSNTHTYTHVYTHMFQLANYRYLNCIPKQLTRIIIRFVIQIAYRKCKLHFTHVI